MGFSPDLLCGEVSENLKCPICFEVMLEPVMLHPCEHFFCKPCIHAVLRSDNHCPIDRAVFDESSIRKAHNFVLSVIGNLKIKCKFQPDCDVIVRYKEAEGHEFECKFNPLNNDFCDTCSCPITLATAKTHDCHSYFQSRISQLQAENKDLRSQIAQLKADSTKSNGKSPGPKVNGIEKAFGSLNLADSSDVISSPRQESSSPITSRNTSSLSRETIVRKLNHMIQAIQSLQMPTDCGSSWSKSPFLKSVLQLIEPNPKISNIFIQSDLLPFFYMEKFTRNFTIEKFKRNSIFFLHVLLFDFLEPSIKCTSKVLILDYIDNGITQWVSRVARLVTTAVNPTFIEAYRGINKTTSLGRSKVAYIPFKRGTNKLTKEIKCHRYDYDLILTFSLFSEEDIQKLMAKFCSKGRFVAFNREHFSLKVYTWESDDTRSKLNVETLLTKVDLEFFYPLTD